MSDDHKLIETINQPNVLAMGNDVDLRPLFRALGIPDGGSVEAVQMNIVGGSNLVEIYVKRYMTRGQLAEAVKYLTDNARPDCEFMTSDVTDVVRQKLEALTQKDPK